MDWRGKVTIQNCAGALVKPKNQPEGVGSGSLMAEMKHNLLCGCCSCWAAKRSSDTEYSQSRHLPVPKAAIRAFHIIMNSPLLQSASSK